MKKKILTLILALAATFGVLMPSGNVFADGDEDDGSSCNVEFLGLRPWYYGLDKIGWMGGDCNVKAPQMSGSDGGKEAGDEIAKFIWVIILNVLVDLFTIAGIVALGFVIYGGYLFLRSGGDVNFATKGRKTLTAALVGLLIVTLANVISRLITTVIAA